MGAMTPKTTACAHVTIRAGHSVGGGSCPPTQTTYRPHGFPKPSFLPCNEDTLCSKTPSSRATKGLICHPDHLHGQRWHGQVSPWLSPSPGCGEGLVVGSGQAPGNVITPQRALSSPPGCRFGSPKGDMEAGHHLVVPGHSTRQPTRTPPTHALPRPLAQWGPRTRACAPPCPRACARTHACALSSRTCHHACKRTPRRLYTQSCTPAVRTPAHTHAQAGGCTGGAHGCPPRHGAPRDTHAHAWAPCVCEHA